MKTRVLMEDMYPLIEEMLKVKGSISFTVSGVSMQPMLYNKRDTVTLVPPPKKLKKYDLPFYRLDNGQFILHRVIKIHKDGTYECRGDNRWESEDNIRPDQIIGVVKSFTRKGKMFDVDKSVSYRIYIHAWGLLHYLKKYYVYFHRFKNFLKSSLGYLKETIKPIKINAKVGDMGMKEITFRKARKSDIKAIQKLSFDLATYECDNFHEDNTNRYWYTEEQGKNHFVNYQKRHFLWVAVCDKEVIGYISGYISNSELFNSPVGVLKNIYISPQYRGGGIGHKLVNLFKNYCREKNCYNLSVTFYEENISAEKFYKRHGFSNKSKIYTCNIEESNSN